MASFAEEFRTEARSAPGTVFTHKLGGWSYCLSYGPVDPDRALAAFKRDVERVGAVPSPVQASADAVRASLETARADYEWAKRDPKLSTQWMLTAKLWPIGRGSTAKDWQSLGMMLRAMGVPRAAMETVAKEMRSEELGPNDTHCWTWNEEEGPKSAA